MNQISDVLNLAAQARSQNIDAVLATVVHTEGSAYRRAGAMMLICEDGRSVGMISGGCLEPHIIKRAFWLTRQGATLQVYQTGDDPSDSSNSDSLHSDGLSSDSLSSDSLNSNSLKAANNDKDLAYAPTVEETLEAELNFGLGCNGRVYVLFERLETAMPFLDVIRQVRETRQPIRVATLIRSDNVQQQIGRRFNLEVLNDLGDKDDKQYLTYKDPLSILSEYDLADKNTAYVPVVNRTSSSASNTPDAIPNPVAIPKVPNTKNDNSAIATTQTQWLIQKIQPQKRLLIGGAGNDVMPLVAMAKQQDWHVTVIDSRPQYAKPSRFLATSSLASDALVPDRVICLPLDDEQRLIELSRNAAVALMSHSLTQDRARLKVLLQHPPAYLGQLGPRYRTERLLSEILAISDNPEQLQAGIAQLHYPIGVKLGGDGPEALALGIMAQIYAVMHGKQLEMVDSSKHNRGYCSNLIDNDGQKIETHNNKFSNNETMV